MKPILILISAIVLTMNNSCTKSNPHERTYSENVESKQQLPQDTTKTSGRNFYKFTIDDISLNEITVLSRKEKVLKMLNKIDSTYETFNDIDERSEQVIVSSGNLFYFYEDVFIGFQLFNNNFKLGTWELSVGDTCTKLIKLMEVPCTGPLVGFNGELLISRSIPLYYQDIPAEVSVHILLKKSRIHYIEYHNSGLF